MNKELQKLLKEINDKKNAVRSLANEGKIEEAKTAKQELVALQDKFNLLMDLDDDEGDDIEDAISSGRAKDITGGAADPKAKKKNLVKAFVNIVKCGFLKKEPEEADVTTYKNALTSDATPNEEGESGIGVVVPEDIRTDIIELRRSEDNLEQYVNVEDAAQNVMAYINKWIAKKTKATRNAMILKTINTMTTGKEVVISSIDSLKDVFNVKLEPAIALGAVVITNQNGFNYLDKLKDSDGKYILQPNPTQPTQMLLFGKYQIIKVSNKVIKSESITDETTKKVTGYKHPVYMGDLKEAVTLFDRNVITIDMNDKGAGLWEKDMTGIKVRDRFDVQPVDEAAVIKGNITETVQG